MSVENGQAVFMATGSAMYADGLNYWIEEGVIRLATGSDGESVVLVERRYGGFDRFKGSRWRPTKAAAIRDASAALAVTAEKLATASAKAEADAKVAEEAESP